MTTPRSKQINIETTPFYHIMSRCVRRSYLCGKDLETGRDYSHRKEWLVSRIKRQSQIFAINIAAYAIMDNHYHLVLHVNAEQARGWSDSEVMNRWACFYPGDAKRIQDLAAIDMNNPEVNRSIIKWRDRLMSISWYMKALNQYMARLCNLEDNCKGRFWEGRFKSQALLDEAALLGAMVYVDLNPIRAGINNTPEDSDFTSIQERIHAYREVQENQQTKSNLQPADLMPFQGIDQIDQNSRSIINFKLNDYLKLVDETGREVRENKRGSICSSLKPILERIRVNNFGWFKLVNVLENKYSFAIGSKENLKAFGSNRSLKGTNFSTQIYENCATYI